MAEKHILVVDDFKDTREMYGYFLTAKGFRVSLATNGQEALDKTFELRPDLVVIDYSLPMIDGWEATRRIKADERTKHIPVVMLSGHDLSAIVADIGCEVFLVKPCLPNTLVAEIARVLNG
jgi:CheY-like chemotaxis protein